MEFMIPKTDPYVPPMELVSMGAMRQSGLPSLPIVMNVPMTMLKMAHATPAFHMVVRSLCQLSYSHIKPIGWNIISVAKTAPTSEMRPSNTGIPEPIKYPTMVMPPVQPNHAAQWIGVFEVKCLDVRMNRMKKLFAGNYDDVSVVIEN